MYVCVYMCYSKVFSYLHYNVLITRIYIFYSQLLLVSNLSFPLISDPFSALNFLSISWCTVDYWFVLPDSDSQVVHHLSVGLQKLEGQLMACENLFLNSCRTWVTCAGKLSMLFANWTLWPILVAWKLGWSTPAFGVTKLRGHKRNPITCIFFCIYCQTR